MMNGKKICVVLPAYNAESTLEATVSEIPREIVDDIILVDDFSQDATVKKALNLGLHVKTHPQNRGYGGNQKTCYTEALARGADIIIMVHPDYQYTPRLVPALAAALAYGPYDVATGSRILGVGALQGGMPVYKYIANRLLTFIENLFLNHKLSEYHTGYRAFTREVLQELPLEENGDNFIFDNQMLAQAIYFQKKICEISCPTLYFAQASSISFWPSVRYGLGVLWTSLQFRLTRWGLIKSALFSPTGRRLQIP